MANTFSRRGLFLGLGAIAAGGSVYAVLDKYGPLFQDNDPELTLKIMRPKTYGEAISAVFDDGDSSKRSHPFDTEYMKELVDHYAPRYTGMLNNHGNPHMVTISAQYINGQPSIAVYSDLKNPMNPNPAMTEENRVGVAGTLKSTVTTDEVYATSEQVERSGVRQHVVRRGPTPQ